MFMRRDLVIVKNKFCKSHRLAHLGKLHVNEPCHFHKNKINQIHHSIYCKLTRCPNYELMINKQNE